MTTHNTPDNTKPAKASFVYLNAYRTPVLPPRYTTEYKALELMARGLDLNTFLRPGFTVDDLEPVIERLLARGWPVEKGINPMFTRYRVSKETVQLFWGMVR